MRLAGIGGDVESSLPIPVDEMGESHVWIRDRDGRKRWLCSVRKMIRGPTVYIVLTDATLAPPHRIENRSASATLLFRQQGTRVWNELAPMRWRSYLWDDPFQPRRLEVAYLAPSVKRIGAIVAGVYELDRIATLAPLVAPPQVVKAELEDQERARRGPPRSKIVAPGPPDRRGGSSSRPVGAPSSSARKRSGQEQGPGHDPGHGGSQLERAASKYVPERLSVELYANGATRVLSFHDRHSRHANMSPHAIREEEEASFLKRLYYNTEATFAFRGVILNLIESTPSGPAELCAVTLDHVSMRKFGHSDATRFIIYHVQIDDMRGDATFPVVFQPADSGFNSVLRDDRRNVPFFQLGFERDIMLSDVIHFKSFQVR